MSLRTAGAIAMALTAALATACGEPEVSNLSYASVRSAAAGKDEAAFRGWFEAIKGQRAVWSGRVVEIRTRHRDQITLLEVDVDGLAGGTTDADVVFPVQAWFGEEMAAGSEIAFTGTVDDFAWLDRRPLLRLEVKRVRGA